MYFFKISSQEFLVEEIMLGVLGELQMTLLHFTGKGGSLLQNQATGANERVWEV